MSRLASILVVLLCVVSGKKNKKPKPANPLEASVRELFGYYQDATVKEQKQAIKHLRKGFEWDVEMHTGLKTVIYHLSHTRSSIQQAILFMEKTPPEENGASMIEGLRLMEKNVHKIFVKSREKEAACPYAPNALNSGCRLDLTEESAFLKDLDDIVNVEVMMGQALRMPFTRLSGMGRVVDALKGIRSHNAKAAAQCTGIVEKGARQAFRLVFSGRPEQEVAQKVTHMLKLRELQRYGGGKDGPQHAEHANKKNNDFTTYYNERTEL